MIIAFSGKSKAGKTTAANYLSTQYGFQVVSFAGTLKILAQTFFPFTYSELHTTGKDKNYKKHEWTPREFLIRLGHFIRFHDENFLIDALDVSSKRTDYAIDDLRFENEARALKEKGAKLIRIERYKKHLNDINDKSETELDNYKEFDYVINDVENRDLNSLFIRLDLIMSELGYAKRYPF